MMERHDFRENLRLALDTIRGHKLRSFLTVLGVVIGVGVIIVVASLITGFDRAVTSEFSEYGADTAFVSKFAGGFGRGRLTKEERMRKPLTLADADAVKENAPAVRNIAVSIFPRTQSPGVRYKDQEVIGIDFRGTFPAYADVYANAAIKRGRFFTAGENESRQKVTVLGENVADTFFPNVDPIGKEVLVDGSVYRVVGVFEKPKGGFGDSDEDRRVFIPYYTIRKVYPQAEEHGFRIQAHTGQLELAVEQTRTALRRSRKVGFNAPDSFGITTSQQMTEQFHDITAMVYLVMVVLSSIGLLVGGVGVMNIMLVSVTERTREIGVRKAIGAKRSDIRWQFLLEAMTLTGLGGVLGILVSGSIALLIPVITTFRTGVPVWAVVAGIIVACGVGLVFGTWPAMKAARLDPVDALRYE
jgi:ABC-type antimicrobial peptide transport system permease subunit